MADASKITLGQLKTALTQAKNYTDNEIAGITGASKVEPEASDMPKVFFNGDKPTTKDSVYATIEYVSNTEHFKGYVDIKCQGTSSMSYPKKNYTIKMFTDETMVTKLKKDFKGWGEQSKFCLKANYIDHSHARNIIGAKLWDEIVASRTNYTELPELLRTSPRNGAIDGFPIKVYYNNTYEGVYTWNIPKDKWMFNMDDALDNHCVLCGEEYDSGCFRSANASLWSDEIHDVMPESIKTSFNNFISFVMNSSDDEFKTNLGNYVYIDSLIDYYIFQYVICGLDSMGKNQLFATYDGTKWIATSYDMDSTFGMYWNGQKFVSAEYRMQEDYESMAEGRAGNLLYMRLEELFTNEIKARYAELKSSVLSYANIVDKFERFMDIIGKDLYAEDLTIYTGIPSGSTNNIQQIRNYTRDRLTYVDVQIKALGPAIPCTSISLNQTNVELTADNRTVTLVATVEPSDTTNTITWSSNAPDIATVDNGLVTAKTNGSTVITATCGSQSATCNITVSGISESGGGGSVSANLVFQVNSTSMNSSDNTLTDNIAGITATLTGNPTVSDNQIAFTASDAFNFNISSLNLTSGNRTVRVKFTPTTLDANLRNILTLGEATNNWNKATTVYINNSKLAMQHGSSTFSNHTVGSDRGGNADNRLSSTPATNIEYEIVISENIDGNVRWFIDGTLVQDGTSTLFNPLYISNAEGNNRFTGSYSLIEIYNAYCDTYTKFTNMVNNTSSGGDTDTNILIYPATSLKVYNGALTQDEIKTNLEYEISRTNFVNSANEL